MIIKGGKTMRRTLSLISVILCALVLSSCSLRDALLSAMGFDTYDYEGEDVLSVVSPESAEARNLCEMVRILSVNNPMLPEFESAGEAVDECRDAILNYLLCTGFSMYMGNTELIEEAEEKYPELRLITVIPAEDFENFVYTYFGGNAKVTNKSSELFTYLDKAEAYTAVTEPIESEISVNVVLCEKTEKTYRLKFRCSHGEAVSPVYRALIVRRPDGSAYFKSLKIVEE